MIKYQLLRCALLSENLQGLVGDSIDFEWKNFPGAKTLDILQVIQQSSCQCSMMSIVLRRFGLYQKMKFSATNLRSIMSTLLLVHRDWISSMSTRRTTEHVAKILSSIRQKKRQLIADAYVTFQERETAMVFSRSRPDYHQITPTEQVIFNNKKQTPRGFRPRKA